MGVLNRYFNKYVWDPLYKQYNLLNDYYDNNKHIYISKPTFLNHIFYSQEVFYTTSEFW